MRGAAAAPAPCCSQRPTCRGGQGPGGRRPRLAPPAKHQTRNRNKRQVAEQPKLQQARRAAQAQQGALLGSPRHAAKVGQHARAVAGNQHRVGAQLGSLDADGLCDAGRRAVHLEAQQQLLVLDACEEGVGGGSRPGTACGESSRTAHVYPPAAAAAPRDDFPCRQPHGRLYECPGRHERGRGRHCSPGSSRHQKGPALLCDRPPLTLELQQRHVSALQHRAPLMLHAQEEFLGVAAGGAGNHRRDGAGSGRAGAVGLR